MVEQQMHINLANAKPFGDLDMGRLLQERARTHSDRTFLTWAPFENTTNSWTYSTFERDVARIASGLTARGIGLGDRVLLHLENCPEFLLSWHALARVGAIAVATNARASGDELAYFANHSDVMAAITQPDLLEVVEVNCPNLMWIAVTTHNAGTEPKFKDRPTRENSFKTLFGDAASAPIPIGDNTLPVAIHFTSGSTARPKGVVWTHDNALWGAMVSARHEKLQVSDKFLVTLPLFHVISGIYSVMASLWAGSEIVLQPRFSVSQFWPAALEHRCTWASLVPFCTKALLNEEVPPRHWFRHWGHAILNSQVENHFNVSLLGWWGMTEVITHGIVGDPNLTKRNGAIGRAAPEYELAILKEDGKPVKPGETGELRIRGIRGLSLFKEYLNDPEATHNSFDKNNYFITGDLVTLHEDGLLSFSDRIKDMLKVGGENVSAAEIERVILQVSGVKEVAVVAKSDSMRGQVPVAFVIKDDEEISSRLSASIVKRCQNTLSDFKVPNDVRIVSSLPRTGGAAKVSKPELRRRIETEALQSQKP